MNSPASKRNPRWRPLGWALPALFAVLVVGYWQMTRQPAPVSLAVPGGDGGGLPRATPESEGFDAVGLQRAADYARSNGAQAFLVMRHSHLVVERYGGGVDVHSDVDGGSFAELLVALAAGIAVRDHAMSEPHSPLASAALAAQIAAASHLSYPQFLSRKLWQPLNAAAAQILLTAPGATAPADCCLQARATDWLRVAELVIADGRFEGTQVLPAGWAQRVSQPSVADPGRAMGLWLASSAHGAEPYVAHEVLFLRGPGQTRLWMAPRQAIAILLVAPAGSGNDETRLPNMVFRALRESPSGTNRNIGDLVPHH